MTVLIRVKLLTPMAAMFLVPTRIFKKKKSCVGKNLNQMLLLNNYPLEGSIIKSK